MIDAPSGQERVGEVPLRAAASLILMRDVVDGPPELLMLRRHAGMAFAGGAWVFPGGGVEAADAAAVVGDGDTDERADAAARICAIRETLEETGLAAGFREEPAAEHAAELRRSLAAGETLAAALAERSAALAPARLTPFARWIPLPGIRRRFDTRFYLAAAPLADRALADGAEGTETRWIAAAAALRLDDGGEMPMLFPTRSNLHRLAAFGSFAEACAAARTMPVRPLSAVVEDRDGAPHLVVPDGFGYPPIAEPLARFVRG